MPYDSTNLKANNDLFEKLERLALKSPIRALLMFESHEVPDGEPIWWKVRKGIFYAICSFMLKKFRTGSEMVQWAEKEWAEAKVKETCWVPDNHSRAIEALEYDLQAWATEVLVVLQ